MSLNHLSDRLTKLSELNRRRELVPRKINGVRLIQSDGRELINFGANDYLGIAAQRAMDRNAMGSMASALVCGWTDQHQQLAEMLAELESTPAVCLFPTGFAACMGTVSTLAESGDLILSDQLNHASLIDGCRLSRADRMIYPHRDVTLVEETLKRRRAEYTNVWIVTDGVFGMDGHVAPLEDLVEVADRFDAMLIVDEAHATGVLGDHGSGVCEALGVKSRVPVRIGTLSKALGGQGGFVAGPQVVIDYLVNRCRSLIYSTSLVPSAVASAIAAVQCIAAEPQRRQRIQRFSQEFRQQVSLSPHSHPLGDPLTASDLESRVPIIPVMIGGDRETLDASKKLSDAGFFVPAIRPPTVPEGTARLRVSLSAAHDDAMIHELAAAFRSL